MMIDVSPIFVGNSNVVWLLSHGAQAYVIDPTDSDTVMAALEQHHLTLSGILITHHHHDHTAGIPGLRHHYPGIPVYGPEHITGVTQAVTEGQHLSLSELALTLTVRHIPAHTLDHVLYTDGQICFCGDTLFSAGCGRLFEGTAAQLQQALGLMMSYPDEMLIYCAHEYTIDNLNFALQFEPDNIVMQQRLQWASGQRQQGLSSLPTSLKLEKQINPFLRIDLPAYQQLGHDSLQRLSHLRQLKDDF